MALIRKGQARQDIEQRRLAAAARADQTNKLTLLDAQIDIIQRQHRGARGAKPLGYPFDDELGRRGGLQLKACCGHGFSTSRDKSGALRRNPTDCAVDISALRASSDTSLVNTIRFQADATSSGANLACISASNSSRAMRCASVGFALIHSVSSRWAATNLRTSVRCVASTSARATSTVVIESRSLTRI